MVDFTNLSLTTWFLLCYLCLNSLNCSPPVDISPRCIVWGPGLEPSVVLPVRYFFIQAINSAGENHSTSAGVDIFRLSITSSNGTCPVFKEILDRKDGTYLVRYRLYKPCDGLRIEITLDDGRHVAASPYIFKEKILHTDCNCPIELSKWKETSKCPSSFPQIDRDMAQFGSTEKFNISEIFATLSARHHPQAASFCYYVVRNQQLYRKCFGEHVGFTMFMDQVILYLLRRTRIPDVELVVNLGDYPLSAKKRKESQLPVFSWCGSVDHHDIVMPTYDVTESSLHAMDRVSLDILSVQATRTPVWKDKIPKGFWRGRDAREERLKLIKLARNHSDLIDAGLTHFFFFRDEESVYGPSVPSVNLFQFFQYKYQLNLDGTVAAYRFPYLLAGDGVVFKQDSPYFEHFYHDLQPWIHYIPVQRDLSDLVEKLHWAIEHDEKAQRISKRGSDYARENLLPAQIFCYYALLLEQWSSKVVINPLGDGLIAVPQQLEKSGKCSCSFLGNEFVAREEL